jgi:glucose-1-phosphate thymidylyltransferase
VITRPEDQALFRHLLEDGSQWGLRFDYVAQPSPGGLAQAFLLGREFAAGDPCALILGDNIFYGHGMVECLRRAAAHDEGATVFGYWVNDPQRYGVVAFDAEGRAVSIEEKPARPRSSYAVTGLYFYDGRVCDLAATLKPSPRGELEITDLNNLYLREGRLRVEKLGRGFAWLDTGTTQSLLQAANFVQTVEDRQGLKICCPEEIAWRMGYIDADQLRSLAEPLVAAKSGYGQYLLSLLDQPQG